MKLHRTDFILLGIILISFIFAAIIYPKVPESMASHWNIDGRVDGYLPRFWGTFLMPFIGLLMFGVFLLIPRIDPKRANIEQFRKYFDTFIILLFLFLFYFYILTIIWNLGHTYDLMKYIIPAFAVIFFYAGILIEQAKPNWSIGIRTPWTLSDDNVWQKTHEVGSSLFKACGLIALVGIFGTRYAFWFVISPILLSTIFVIIYSYILYRSEEKIK